MFKKTLVFLLCLFICLLPEKVKAESPYVFCDGDKQILSFTDIKEAWDYFDEHITEYDDPILYYQDEVLDMKYGVVSFLFEQ